MTMRRLLWIWALISVGWGILIIAPHWSEEPSPPSFWDEEHPECRDRLAFWPDGTRMGDDDLYAWLGKSELSDRRRWARDVWNKIRSCEYAEWGPIEIQKQRLELLVFALVPQAILCLVGAAIAFGWKYYGETIARYFLRLPRRIGRGLIRLYILVAVPWVAWFYYMAYRQSQRSDWDAFERAILALPVVPVGALILYFVVRGSPLVSASGQKIKLTRLKAHLARKLKICRSIPKLLGH